MKALPARIAYDMAAPFYEDWKWYSFWRSNEGPLVAKWIKTCSGVGVDAGCGNAPYLNDFVSSSSGLIFLDISYEMLKRIKIPRDLNRCHVVRIQGDLRSIPIREGAADYLLCSRAISNIDDLLSVFIGFSRVLKKGGRFLLTDIHPHHDYSFTRIEIEKGEIYVETYIRSIQEIIGMAVRCGFTLKRYEEYGLIDLANKPDRKGFEKIFLNPTAPIFFLIEFVRTA